MRRKSLVEVAESRLDRRARIDVAGSSEFRGDALQRDAVHAEDAARSRERIHGDLGSGAGAGAGVGVVVGAGVALGAGVAAGTGFFGGSGSLSGPFWPHPASAIATAMAAVARIIRAL